MQVHCLGAAPWQDQANRCSRLGTDRAEDVGRSRALVLRGRGPRAPASPAPDNLVLLPDPGLVAEPDLYAAAANTLRARDRIQARGGTFQRPRPPLPPAHGGAAEADRVRQRCGIYGVVEVVTGHLAAVAIWVGRASIVGGVSLAMAFVCM